MGYCIVLYCIVLCYNFTVLYCIVLYCIVLCFIILYGIELYCIVLYYIVLYLLYFIVLYSIVLYCIELYYIILNCRVTCHFCIIHLSFWLMFALLAKITSKYLIHKHEIKFFLIFPKANYCPIMLTFIGTSKLIYKC